MYEFLLPVIVALNITYIYFWLVVLYARAHGHIDKRPITNRLVWLAARRAIRRGDPYLFVVQITTKGGSLPVVLRGIDNVIQAAAKFHVLRKLVSVEVITEDLGEVRKINRTYRDAIVRVRAFMLPPAYETPDGTRLKARALHYMVELHRQVPRPNAYIVHYDEESVFTPDNLARLVFNLCRNPVGISEGTISYALEWSDAHVMCRTMESNRPFGCHECFLMMTHPAPLHLHGSNLVIQERIENEIGWDIGCYQGGPLIAEDLVFGLMAYLKFGGDVFGWHYVEMIEQPPFTLKAAYKQRERWVFGALQGVSHVMALPGWSTLPRWERWKIQLGIRFRVATYALGLPVSLVSLLTWGWLGASDLLNWSLGAPLAWHWSWLALPGLVMWIGSNQLGLTQNLSYTAMTRGQRVVEHLKVLACTPFAGLYDTAGPFVAVCKWLRGQRTVLWIPTPKMAAAVPALVKEEVAS